MGRSLSVHCHLMALIVCCSVQHKPSRQASPFTCTTSANHKEGGKDKRNLLFGRTKEIYGLDKMSVLGIQTNSPTTPKKTHILKRAQLGMTVDGQSCKALKANQVNRWRAMLGKKQICLTWRATQISTRPHSFWAFSFFSSSRGSPGRLQVADNSL